jgi:DNA-binding response OmpR family regulator
VVRILLVEDERRLAQRVDAGLRGDGFLVEAAPTLEHARDLLSAAIFDAMVLDLGLPDGDGLDLLRDLRRRGTGLPVLALTARDAIERRVAGLDAGADDYLVKPFAMVELSARIRALLRRPGAVLGQHLRCGNIAFDTHTRELTIGTVAIALARRELALLETLLRRQGRVVTKEVLIEQIYDTEDDERSHAIPVHVHHLRKALERHGSSTDIVTLRGLGYVLRERRG